MSCPGVAAAIECVALGQVVARGEAVEQGGGKLWPGGRFCPHGSKDRCFLLQGQRDCRAASCGGIWTISVLCFCVQPDIVKKI